MMRVLIYGGKGWIGSTFVSALNEQDIDVIVGEAIVDNTKAMNSEICRIGPTHIVCMIGSTCSEVQSTEMSEKLDENLRDNLFVPLSLCILCSRRGIHLTYLGTGCIYDGIISYKESDLPNCKESSYSIVNGYTDCLMHLCKDNVLNLRISMAISSKKHPYDFISQICSYEYISNISNSLTVLPNFIPIWIDMMKTYKTGTYNCVNPGMISNNEILTMYRDIVDPNFTWKNITIVEQDISKCNLDTTKLKRAYPKIDHIKEGIKEILLQRYDSLVL